MGRMRIAVGVCLCIALGVLALGHAPAAEKRVGLRLVLPCRTLVRRADTGGPLRGATGECPLVNGPTPQSTIATSGDDGLLVFLGAAGTEYAEWQADPDAGAAAAGGLLVAALLGGAAQLAGWDGVTQEPFPGHAESTSHTPAAYAAARDVSGYIEGEVRVCVSCDGYRTFDGRAPVWYAVGPWGTVRPGTRDADAALRGKGGCYLDEIVLAPQGSGGESHTQPAPFAVAAGSCRVNDPRQPSAADLEVALSLPEVLIRTWGPSRLPFAVTAHSAAFSDRGAATVRDWCDLTRVRATPLSPVGRPTGNSATFRADIALRDACLPAEYAVCVHVAPPAAQHAPRASALTSRRTVLAYRQTTRALYSHCFYYRGQLAFRSVAVLSLPSGTNPASSRSPSSAACLRVQTADRREYVGPPMATEERRSLR
jgi:hypothetical protein